MTRYNHPDIEHIDFQFDPRLLDGERYAICYAMLRGSDGRPVASIHIDGNLFYAGRINGHISSMSTIEQAIARVARTTEGLATAMYMVTHEGGVTFVEALSGKDAALHFTASEELWSRPIGLQPAKVLAVHQTLMPTSGIRGRIVRPGESAEMKAVPYQ